MNTALLVLPVLMPLLTACACAFTFRILWLTSFFSITGAFATLISAGFILANTVELGIQVTAFGNWQAPFGIVFVADRLSASMVFISSMMGVTISLYSCSDLKEKSAYPLYHAMIHILLAGVAGSFLTGDIFNLYVWFEVMLIASFGLMTLDANKAQVSAAIRYVILNLISTMVLLLAIGLLYGATGSLNMADIHLKISTVPQSSQQIIAGLFFFGLAIKSSLFPLFSWLPASYPHLPSAVVALFAALLTKVGVYAMIRLFTLIFNVETSGYQTLLMMIAGLTMLTGVLGAASQFHIKRILSFHIISQIGYMLMGLALLTPLALTGAIFYIIHHIIVKANLFLISGYIEKRFGTDNLANIGGLFKSTPLLALLFIIPALSLAGFPPLSGFWGKFLVIKASLQTEHYILASTALFVSLMTIFSMTKIWAEAFWKPLPDNCTMQPLSRLESLLYLSPILFLCSLTIIIGLWVEPIYQLAYTASENLINPRQYIEAVLSPEAIKAADSAIMTKAKP